MRDVIDVITILLLTTVLSSGPNLSVKYIFRNTTYGSKEQRKEGEKE